MKKEDIDKNIRIMRKISTLLDQVVPYGELNLYEIIAIKKDMKRFERQHNGIDNWDKWPHPLCPLCKGWGWIRE